MLKKYEYALAATTCKPGKEFWDLKRKELQASCDKQECDLWHLGFGCTVGYCRRIEQ